MASPLGPVLANIFMSNLESKALESFSGTKPLFYRRFVDDTIVIFETKQEMLDFFSWMNGQHRCIKFTKEEEVNGVLPFLDVLVTREESGQISTSLYRKPTFSGLYLKWDSFVPLQFKRGLVNSLIHRSWNICSTYEKFHQEVEFIRSILAANGYPINFINSCVKKYLDRLYVKKSQEVLPVFGPQKKPVIISLPFLGDQSQKLKRQLLRLIKAVAPWIKLTVVFTPVFKLACLSKLKCQIPVLSLSNVVYKINCKDCSEFYIGKTYRRLSQRIKEHSTSDGSALTKHAITTNHTIDFDNPEVLATDLHHTRLLIKETLKIKDYSAYKSLNGNSGSFDLMLF